MIDEIEEAEELLDRLLIHSQEMLSSSGLYPLDIQRQLSDQIRELSSYIDTLYEELDMQQSGQPPVEPARPNIDTQALDDENLKFVWRLAGGNRDVFIQYLSSFPNPRFQQLLRNPDDLNNIIDHLSINNPISNTGVVVDGISKSGINSSNVYGVKYDFDKNRLLVRFNNGSVYGYDVPSSFYSLVGGGQAAARTNDRKKPRRWWVGKNPSLGAAVWQYLRETGVPYQRLR